MYGLLTDRWVSKYEEFFEYSFIYPTLNGQ